MNTQKNIQNRSRKILFILIAVIAFAILSAGAVSSFQQAYAKEEAPVFQTVKQTRYLKETAWLLQKPESGAKKAEKVKKSSSIRVSGISGSGWSRVVLGKKTYYIRSAKLGADNGYLVAIDAGHQRKGNPSREPIGPGAKAKKPKVSSGATGNYTGIPEYKLTLKMAKKLEKELIKRGYKVKMIRTKHDVNLSNSKRAKIANKAKADAFIRIHANSSESSRASGALTISPTKRTPYCKSIYKESSRLSSVMLSRFCKATGAKNRGVMYTDTMSGINWSKVPVTIVEMGFLSNKTEDRKMNRSKVYQKKMTRGMADGLDAYFHRL